MSVPIMPVHMSWHVHGQCMDASIDTWQRHVYQPSPMPWPFSVSTYIDIHRDMRTDMRTGMCFESAHRSA